MNTTNKISKLINSDVGKILISVLLGLGLATLFRKACNDRNCLVFYAPPQDKVNDKIFKFNDKCYTYSTSAVSCSANKKIIPTEPIKHV